MSGGGAGTSWTKLENDTTDGVHDIELWLGTIAATGCSPINVTFSGTIGSEDVELIAQEYSSGLGAATVWSDDNRQHQQQQRRRR